MKNPEKNTTATMNTAAAATPAQAKTWFVALPSRVAEVRGGNGSTRSVIVRSPSLSDGTVGFRVCFDGVNE
ncbi:MAG: hypothetical protein ACXWZ5_07450 [Mycobacterium sp.]